MNNTTVYVELTAAIADLDKTRSRLVSLQTWARGELAKENTQSARALLERTVPEELRENAPIGVSEAVRAGACFREVTSILKR